MAPSKVRGYLRRMFPEAYHNAGQFIPPEYQGLVLVHVIAPIIGIAIGFAIFGFRWIAARLTHA